MIKNGSSSKDIVALISRWLQQKIGGYSQKIRLTNKNANQ
jgi:hypothetical protein